MLWNNVPPQFLFLHGSVETVSCVRVAAASGVLDGLIAITVYKGWVVERRAAWQCMDNVVQAPAQLNDELSAQTRNKYRPKAFLS